LKALVVRLSAIGDVVHTLPAVAALRREGFGVGFAVEPLSRVLLENNPAVDAIERVPASRRFRLDEARFAVSSLRRARYDVALDFQGLWKSAIWARLSGAQRILGYARAWRREPASALLAGERIALPAEAVHVIDKNLALLRGLGIDAVGTREFPLPDTATEAARVESELRAAGLTGFVVLNPGGGWASKLWPAERFGALAAKLLERGLPSVVTWGPGEEALADRVVAASRGAAIRSFPTTLLEYVEIARRAKLVVAADTGTFHLACAIGTPVVGLFGPTDPSRNGPFAPADLTVRHVPPCAPCHRRVCPTHQGIMERISVEEVLTAVDARLGAEPGRTRRAV
jgi:lipopolysaccharide heptosyltransferase I